MTIPLAPRAGRLAFVVGLVAVAGLAAWALLRLDNSGSDRAGVAASRPPPTGAAPAAGTLLPESGRVRARSPLEAAAPNAPVASEDRSIPTPAVAAPASYVVEDAPPSVATQSLLLSGRCVDPHATPVAGADVFHVPSGAVPELDPSALTAAEPMQGLKLAELAHATTGQDGTFEFHAHARTAHTPSAAEREPSLLVIRRAGFAISVLPCVAADSSAPRFDAGTLVLRAGGAVAARVLDSTGAPVAGAALGFSVTGASPFDPVTGRWDLLRQVLLATSDADGRVHADGFEAGAIEFDCLHPEFVPVTLSAVIEPDRTTDLGDIVLTQGGSLAGTVTDADGQPIADASVLVRVSELSHCRPDEDPVLSNLLIHAFVRGAHDVRTRTGARGGFRVSTLNHERYAVFADSPGHEPVCADDVPVGTTDLHLVLPREASVVLLIVDRTSGEPLAGAHATAQRCRSGSAATVRSYGPYLDVLTGDAAASAAGLTRDGSGLLLVRRPGIEGTQVSVAAPGHASETFVLPGVAPPARIERTLALDARIMLEGLVLEASGQPIANARILLVPRDPESGAALATRSAVSDLNGMFSIPDLSGGAWTAMASAGGWADSTAQTVELLSGAAPASLTFIMQRGGFLSGSVTTGSGATLPPGVRVRIVSPSGQPVAVPVGSSFGSDTATSIAVDASGSWTCTRVLAPGPYRVMAIRPGTAASAGSESVLAATTVLVAGGGTLSVPLVVED